MMRRCNEILIVGILLSVHLLIAMDDEENAKFFLGSSCSSSSSSSSTARKSDCLESPRRTGHGRSSSFSAVRNSLRTLATARSVSSSSSAASSAAQVNAQNSMHDTKVKNCLSPFSKAVVGNLPGINQFVDDITLLTMSFISLSDIPQDRYFFPMHLSPESSCTDKAFFTAIAFNPKNDATILIPSSLNGYDYKAHVINWKTKKEIQSFDHDKPVTAVAYSNDSSKLATSSDQKIFVWSSEQKEDKKLLPLNEFTHSDFAVKKIEFSSDENKLLVSASNSITVYDLQENRMLMRIPRKSYASAKFSPSSNCIVMPTNNDARLIFYDWETSETVDEFECRDTGDIYVRAILDFAFNKDGTKLAVSQYGVEVFDVIEKDQIEQGRDKRSLQYKKFVSDPSEICFLAFNANDTEIIMAVNTQVYIWNWRNDQVLALLEHKEPIRNMVVNNTGDKIATRQQQGNLFVWDISVVEKLLTLDQKAFLWLLNLDPYIFDDGGINFNKIASDYNVCVSDIEKVFESFPVELKTHIKTYFLQIMQ